MLAFDISKNIKTLCASLCFLPVFLSLPVVATVDVIAPMNFGTIAIIDNSVVGSITITSNGQMIVSSNIKVIEAGSPAEFLLSDYPNNAQLFITANVTQMGTNSVIFSSEQFTLSDLDVVDYVFTDTNGMATVFVGGKFTSTGTGNNYVDTTYNNNFELVFNY